MIIELNIDSYREVVELWNAAGLPFKPEGRESFDFLKWRLETTPTRVFGIRSGDKLVAVVIVSHDGQRGWINRLAVHPDFRRNGYGKLLIGHSESYLRQLGIGLWAALIEHYNGPSMRLFESCGYNKHHDIIYFSKRVGSEY